MDKHLLELYSDYLLSRLARPPQRACRLWWTGRSVMIKSRAFSAADYDGRTLWQQVKPLVRDIQQDDGASRHDPTKADG